jgi:hypothetical protein
VKLASRLVLSVAAAAALLWILARWGGVDWAECWRTLRALSPATFAGALAIHLGIYLVRAQRFRLLLPAGERPSLVATLWISSAHNLATYVLPAKTGEATFVLYMKGVCDVSAGAGLASLVVSRLLDLAVMTGVGALTVVYLAATGRWSGPAWAAAACAAGLGLASLMGTWISFRGSWLVAGGRAFLRWILPRGSLTERLDGLGERLGRALADTPSGLRGTAAALSAVIWAGIFLFYTVLARGFGVPEHVGLFETVFGSGAAVLTNLLPINPFAGLGTQETGWVMGFAMVGVSRAESFPTGLAVHLVQLVDTLLLGIAGHVYMGFARSRPARDGHSN